MEHFADEGKCDEPHKYRIQLVESGEHSGDSLSNAETISPPHCVSYTTLCRIAKDEDGSSLAALPAPFPHGLGLRSVLVALIRPIHQ